MYVQKLSERPLHCDITCNILLAQKWLVRNYLWRYSEFQFKGGPLFGKIGEKCFHIVGRGHCVWHTSCRRLVAHANQDRCFVKVITSACRKTPRIEVRSSLPAYKLSLQGWTSLWIMHVVQTCYIRYYCTCVKCRSNPVSPFASKLMDREGVVGRKMTKAGARALRHLNYICLALPVKITPLCIPL